MAAIAPKITLCDLGIEFLLGRAISRAADHAELLGGGDFIVLEVRSGRW
jgi:hypothetical protein